MPVKLVAIHAPSVLGTFSFPLRGSCRAEPSPRSRSLACQALSTPARSDRRRPIVSLSVLFGNAVQEVGDDWADFTLCTIAAVSRSAEILLVGADVFNDVIYPGADLRYSMEVLWSRRMVYPPWGAVYLHFLLVFELCVSSSWLRGVQTLRWLADLYPEAILESLRRNLT